MNIFYQRLSIPSRSKSSKSFKYSAFCTNLYTYCSILGKTYDRYNPNKEGGLEKGVKNPFYDEDKEKMSKKIGIGFASFFISLNEKIGEKRFKEIFEPKLNNKETRSENFVYIFIRIAENYFKHYKINKAKKDSNIFFNHFSEVINRIDDSRLDQYRKGTSNELRMDTLGDLNNEINVKIPGFARVTESKLKKEIKK